MYLYTFLLLQDCQFGDNSVTIYRICEGLGISLSDFFSDNETIVATCNENELVWFMLTAEDNHLLCPFLKNILHGYNGS
jgi:hypothetical protein